MTTVRSVSAILDDIRHPLFSIVPADKEGNQWEGCMHANRNMP